MKPETIGSVALVLSLAALFVITLIILLVIAIREERNR